MAAKILKAGENYYYFSSQKTLAKYLGVTEVSISNWKKQGKETKYALRLIPLGGFVNMIGEAERSDEEGSFSKASIPKRLIKPLVNGWTSGLLHFCPIFPKRPV